MRRSTIQGLLAELHEIDREIQDQDKPALPDLRAGVSPTSETRFLKQGPLTLDLHARHGTLDDKLVPVPPAAFDYLLALARRTPDPVASEKLALQAQAYQVSRVQAQEIVRWHVHQLRQTLEPDPKLSKLAPAEILIATSGSKALEIIHAARMR